MRSRSCLLFTLLITVIAFAIVIPYASAQSLTQGGLRGTATILSSSPVLANGTVIIYILDANNALLFESDGDRILTGTITRQF